jgi:hypothetical protein
VVPGREKEQRSEEGEGGKHEGLKPTDAEEAGVFLNGDIGESKKEGGKDGPSGGDPVGLIGPPRSLIKVRGKGKEGDGEGGEDGGANKARAERFVEKKKGEEGDENSFDSE